MKTTTLALFTLLVPLVGCDPAASSVGELDSAIKSCPPEGCAGPGDPGDPPPPKKPPAPQPDPAKYRTAYLSTAFLKETLDTALWGTKVQLTHTTGNPQSIPAVLHTCTTTGNTPEQQQDCEDACESADGLTPAQKAACKAQCGGHTTCTNFCGTRSVMSYVHWGNAAVAASKLSSSQTCDTTTCPFCPTKSTMASLQDKEITIDPYTTSVGIWPAEVDITCKVNQLVLQAAGNITVDSTPEALYVTMPGNVPSPAVICDNAPDLTVDNFGVQLRMTFPWAQSTVMTEASTVGDWHALAPGVAWLVSLSDHISDAVKNGTHDMLNSSDTQKTMWNLFGQITAQYAKTYTGETFSRLGYIESQYGQLKVTYYVQ
jgi:hypothetical protein